MYVILATFQKFNFCYLLRFINISSVRGAFSLSVHEHAQNIETQIFLLRKSRESFDTGIVKKLRKFQYWPKKVSYEKACIGKSSEVRT